jgi:hypothetical protein
VLKKFTINGCFPPSYTPKIVLVSLTEVLTDGPTELVVSANIF